MWQFGGKKKTNLIQAPPPRTLPLLEVYFGCTGGGFCSIRILCTRFFGRRPAAVDMYYLKIGIMSTRL